MPNVKFAWDNNETNRFELPGARPHYTPDRPGQVEHISLDLHLNFSKQRFTGTCQIRLNPVRDGIDRLTLDAVGLAIEEVLADGEPQPFDSDGEQLAMRLDTPTVADRPVLLEIRYRVDRPRRGLYFVGPTDNEPDKPVQVWTQGEDEDSRFWFPCFDYPGQLATSEIRVRVPKDFLAISNGELVSADLDGDEKIYHWKQDRVHPTYLMTLAVGRFAEIRDEWNGKPMTYYVERDRLDDAKRSMGKTPRMVDYFSKAFGYAYPFPKYAQVCVADFIFGGMENTSATLLTDRCLLDERAAIDNDRTESLVAHELAHQWFGDLVVIKHWSHAWIKEGMASYAEVLWTEYEYGLDDGAYYLLNEARSYLSEDKTRYRRPIVTNVYREAIELYDSHLYEKGACVYHMIRAELGDELFFKAIATFVNDNAHDTVETVDLLRAIDKATGRNLQSLFDSYVFRGGHPDFQVSYSWDGDRNIAKVTVKQTQAKSGNTIYDRDLFELQVPIAFGSENGIVQRFAVRVNEAEQSFFFALPEKPVFVSFDAGNNILKTVKLKYPTPELVAQLKYDPDPISRIYAAEALAKVGSLEAVTALSNALQSDEFWGVRVEVAKQLASVNLDQAFDELLKGLEDKDARVRRAVIDGLSKIKTRASYKAVKSVLKKGDASYYVEASAAKALGAIAANHPDAKPKAEKAIDRLKWVLETKAGWNEVVRCGAIAGLSQFTTSEAAVNLILDYTQPSVPQALRLAAIRALGPVSAGQSPADLERILARLDRLAGEEFFLTQRSVVVALGTMETPKAVEILSAIAERTADGRITRVAEEAVEKVRKNIGSDKAVKELRRDLEKMKKLNRELLSRLEALEAKTDA
ncbi:M1 family metallopeptidase [Baaleninema simplex]|uniref:M1 family metallopeptidase n=1 Tax=Baaleninema simplex TaxID=2862350 RepID=UPI0003486632|nr:M1 family metallopeptidase [Baaleninema simplex]